MQLIKYQHGDHGLLKKLISRLGPSHSLRYPEFVDYYYAGSDFCDLHVALDDDEVVSLLGVERMQFATQDETYTLGFGSNFASFRPGAGGVLLRHWLRNCHYGIVLGGSDDTHHMLRRLGWTYYTNIFDCYCNKVLCWYPDDPWWKGLSKVLLRRMVRGTPLAERTRRVAADGGGGVEAIEEPRFTEDMLPKESPFAFRCALSVDHLNWRYRPGLSFVRYRVYRIVNRGESVGYVVLNDLPGRLLVAQCDANDPLVLCQGIFAALAEACRVDRPRREVLLVSSHSVMRESFRRYGFREATPQRPLAIGGPRCASPIMHNTDEWLVNLDWGDNGLRAPFLGQPFL